MKPFSRLFVFLIGAILVAGCSPTGSPSTSSELKGTIVISGADALYPIMNLWAHIYQKAYPEVMFDISAGGAGKGMTDALTGAVDIGMVSREITEDEEIKGAYPVAVVKDAVFPVVNADNPVITEIMAKGISKDVFIKIFITKEVKTWGEVIGKPAITDEIHVYTRSDACGAAQMWTAFLSYKQEDIQGIGVKGDPSVLQTLINDPLGIGYNNLGYAFDLSSGKTAEGILPVPIDLNANGVADTEEVIDSLAKAGEMISLGKYPSPPARLDYLVTKGKPASLVANFIKWILTEGQQYVGEAGYVKLTDGQIQVSLDKLK